MNFTTNWQGWQKTCLSLLTTTCLLFCACERPEQIGFELQPQGDVGVFFSDTFQVKTSTVLLDSIETINTTRLLLGAFEDPELGNVRAQSFFELPFSVDSSAVLYLQTQKEGQLQIHNQ